MNVELVDFIVTFCLYLVFLNHVYSDHYSLSNEIDLILKLVLIAKQNRLRAAQFIN